MCPVVRSVMDAGDVNLIIKYYFTVDFQYNVFKLTASSLSPGKSLRSGLVSSCLHSLHLAGGCKRRSE